MREVERLAARLTMPSRGTTTYAQEWGTSAVATAMAVAILRDDTKCATVTNVARLSGQSISAAYKHLSRVTDVFIRNDANCVGACNGQHQTGAVPRHYRIIP